MSSIRKYLPYASGIAVAMIFGFSFLFTKSAFELMSPMQILAYRFTVAALLLSILRVLGIIKLDFRGKKLGNLFALAMAEPVCYFIFETLGIKMTSSSEAGMIIALIPVLVMILAAIFLNEKPSPVQVVFILISVSGVVFITLAKGALKSSSFPGLLVLLVAVASAGVFNILSRKLSLSFKPIEITYVMMWVGAIAFNIIEVIRRIMNGTLKDYYVPLTKMVAWVPVLYLGVLSSVCAFFMLNYMLSKVPAYQSSVISNITTVISIVAGVLIGGEPFYWFHAVGGAMIILGVWGTNYYGIKKAELKSQEGSKKITA